MSPRPTIRVRDAAALMGVTPTALSCRLQRDPELARCLARRGWLDRAMLEAAGYVPRSAAAPAGPAIDVEALAEAVAARVLARLGAALGGGR